MYRTELINEQTQLLQYGFGIHTVRTTTTTGKGKATKNSQQIATGKRQGYRRDTATGERQGKRRETEYQEIDIINHQQ
jgi:hypothetical protein